MVRQSYSHINTFTTEGPLNLSRLTWIRDCVTMYMLRRNELKPHTESQKTRMIWPEVQPSSAYLCAWQEQLHTSLHLKGSSNGNSVALSGALFQYRSFLYSLTEANLALMPMDMEIFITIFLILEDNCNYIQRENRSSFLWKHQIHLNVGQKAN